MIHKTSIPAPNFHNSSNQVFTDVKDAMRKEAMEKQYQTFLAEMKNGRVPIERNLAMSNRIIMYLSFDVAISLLGIYC